MKNLLVLFSLCLSSFALNAQVPNAGFEQLNPNGSIKHWGDLILLAIPIDTDGVPLDTLILDNKFYFSSNDAHSGSKALEMRNGYWTSDGSKVPGRAKLCENDSDYSAFSQPVNFTQVPQNFSFYYKFLPVGNDTAWAWMRLSDSSSNNVGTAEIFISGTHATYTLGSTPIIYSSTVTPAFLEMGFVTAKDASYANYGTRLVIDDVGLSILATGMKENELFEKLQTFPNPANEKLIIKLGNSFSEEDVTVSIMNMEGKQMQTFNYLMEKNIIKVNIESLPSGTYLLKVESSSKSCSGKFVK